MKLSMNVRDLVSPVTIGGEVYLKLTADIRGLLSPLPAGTKIAQVKNFYESDPTKPVSWVYAEPYVIPEGHVGEIVEDPDDFGVANINIVAAP